MKHQRGNRTAAKDPSQRSFPGQATLLLDFDGVISPDSVGLTVELLYTFLSRRHPVPREYIEDLVRLAMPFPVRDTLHYVFDGLGQRDRLPDFIKRFEAFERSGKIHIHPDFPAFAQRWQQKGIDLRVVSTGSRRRLSGLPLHPDRIIDLHGGSKAAPDTFLRVCQELGVSPGRTVIVDDCPVVLLAAHQAGLGTALMATPFFSAEHWRPCAKGIDFRVSGWNGLSRACLRFFR